MGGWGLSPEGPSGSGSLTLFSDPLLCLDTSVSHTCSSRNRNASPVAQEKQASVLSLLCVGLPQACRQGRSVTTAVCLPAGHTDACQLCESAGPCGNKQPQTGRRKAPSPPGGPQAAAWAGPAPSPGSCRGAPFLPFSVLGGFGCSWLVATWLPSLCPSSLCLLFFCLFKGHSSADFGPVDRREIQPVRPKGNQS